MILLLQIFLIILAITGAILNVFKNRLCFMIWIVANICAGILHFEKELYLLIIVGIFYCIINIMGWIKWRKK